jgi:hypothetical protein
MFETKEQDMHSRDAVRWTRVMRLLTFAVAMAMAIGTGATAVPRSADAAYCGGSAYAPPGGAWGVPSQASVAIIGSSGFSKGYTWKVEGNVPTTVGAQAWGFDNSGQGRWYNIGVSSKGGSASVPWGNVLAYPRIRVQSGWVGVQVSWTC